jgi:radical SAM family uncharacterized protein
MANQGLKDAVRRLLHQVQTPGQYLGGEVNSIAKDHDKVRGTLCLCFPDTYAIGQSHHGMQVLYSIMNAGDEWACERAFTPWLDFESLLRRHGLPLYSLETFTPLRDFDLIGFSLQYEVLYTNLLTMLDLGGIPLISADRTMEHPLVVAGGPGAQNPEVLGDVVDLFVIGDGEESLPAVMRRWMELKERGRGTRQEMIAELAAAFPWAYAPAFYAVDYRDDGAIASIRRTRSDLPETVSSCQVTRDLDAIPLPTKPVVSFVKTPHDRIAIEIMRGCPWQCRFCQSTVIKRPLRVRKVETIVNAALEAYRNTGCEEISLLSLSTSDYPHFEELVSRMAEVFGPLGVNVSLPSLRVNNQLRSLPQLVRGVRKGGLTLAPEVARDDMREQIRKKIRNDDLFEGCRQAFRHGWQKVKLYFLCGLPGERDSDLDGIVDMAEEIARISREETGRYREVVASVSNFVPKPHTPYQWAGMRAREYFDRVRGHMLARTRIRSVKIKQHDIDTSFLEGVLTRGDRRVGRGLIQAWRDGARLDGWQECFDPGIWSQAFAKTGIDPLFFSHRERPLTETLPWDHILTKRDRNFLETEQGKSRVQLELMATT